jgi:hypothetical protein
MALYRLKLAQSKADADVAVGSNADIKPGMIDVCFTPEGGLGRTHGYRSFNFTIYAGTIRGASDNEAQIFGPAGPLEASTATVSVDRLIADMRRLHRHVGFVPLPEVGTAGCSKTDLLYIVCQRHTVEARASTGIKHRTPTRSAAW